MRLAPDPTAPTSRLRRLHRPGPVVAALAVLAVLVAMIGPVAFSRSSAGAAPVAAAPDTTTTAGSGDLTAAKAALLGLVEGVTEYLPISSTGHLLITEKLIKVGQDEADKEAINSYTVIIQLGAILAVLVLSWRRVLSVLQGLVGKSEPGRRLLFALVVAFIPAAVIGKGGESLITDHLLKPWPVVAAWIVGGVALLVLWPRLRERPGVALEQLTLRQAGIIGVAQVLALWPGTSRSFVTILAGLAVGLSLSAAVEFSFLLGLLTLGAATAYEALKSGSAVVDRYGTASPLIGIVVAAVAAFVSVRWMVSWLRTKGLEVFGWYRIAAGVVVAVLLITNVI